MNWRLFDFIFESSPWICMRRSCTGLRLRSVYISRNYPVHMAPPEVFRTGRLLLRRPAASDIPDIFAYASDPQVTRYLAWPTYTNADAIYDFLDMAAASWSAGEHYAYLIEKDGRVIGSCGFSTHGGFKADLGYVLHREAWGQGIAVEACTALMDWLRFAGYARIAAFCHADNRASERVMQKLGLEREGLLKAWAIYPNIGPDPQDTLVYAARP
jgi:RimJ/RimL family protein N-acetyltransferase